MRVAKISNVKVGSQFNFSIKSLEGIYVQEGGNRSHQRIDSVYSFGPKSVPTVEAFNRTVFTVVGMGETCAQVHFLRYNSKKGRYQDAETSIRIDRLPAGTRISKG